MNGKGKHIRPDFKEQEEFRDSRLDCICHTSCTRLYDIQRCSLQDLRLVILAVRNCIRGDRCLRFLQLWRPSRAKVGRRKASRRREESLPSRHCRGTGHSSRHTETEDLCHGEQGDKRVRLRQGPEARLDMRDDRRAREPEEGRTGGRDWPRDVPHKEL